jgi:competence protein ComEC
MTHRHWPDEPTQRARPPLTWSAVGLGIGMAWQLQAADLPSVGWARAVMLGAVGLALGVWWVARAWRRDQANLASCTALAALALAMGVAAGFAWAQWRAAERALERLPPALEGIDLRVQGVVASLPQRHAQGQRFVLRVEQARRVDGSEVGLQVPDKIWVSWWGGPRAADEPAEAPTVWSLQRPPPILVPGDRWSFTLRLRQPRGQSNPHGFDAELWLWEQNLHARASVRAGARDQPPQHLGPAGGVWVEWARHAVREAIFERLSAAPGATPEQMAQAQRIAGVVAALVTGDQSSIDRLDWDVFRTTGVAHLMSVSGLHITLFAWLAMALTGALWRRSQRLCRWWPAPIAACWGGVALAASYALFTGWGLPAQRTVWMLVAVCALRALGLRWPVHAVWLLALMAVALSDPWALLQAGFWLSFVAVGVLFAGGPAPSSATKNVAANAHLLGERRRFGLELSGVQRLAAWRIHSGFWLRGQAAQLLSEQLRVSLALAPLSVVLFQQWSVVGLVANLVAIPWVTGVVLPLALLGMAVPPLWEAAALALRLLAAPLQWAAALPGASIDWPAPPLAWAVMALAGAVWLTLRLPWAWRLWGLWLVVPCVLWRPAGVAPGHFELLAVDVGQGQAVLVRTAQHALLYDSGPRYSSESDAGQRVVVPLLRALGTRLDRLVLSHRDTDHTGGALAVLAHQPQAQLLAALEPGHPLRERAGALPCQVGQRWDWDGVRFEVLHPAPEALAQASATAPRPNTLSCVLRIEAATSDAPAAALLMGDVERDQESALLQAQPAALRAQWVLVPHHGSGTSSSTALVAATQAQWAVVQAGWANRYGHPQQNVVQRWSDSGAQVVTTAACGASRWRSARPQQMACWRHERSRYWHAAAGSVELHPDNLSQPARPP